jgi:hypothetical protein
VNSVLGGASVAPTSQFRALTLILPIIGSLLHLLVTR